MRQIVFGHRESDNEFRPRESVEVPGSASFPKAAAPRIVFLVGSSGRGREGWWKNPLKFSLHLEVVVFFGGGGSNMGNDNKTFG